MDKVLYVGMTGARENMLAQQAHANNLANANTTGFKADLAQARSMQVFGEGYASRVYAMSERPATDTTTGSLMETGRDLDIAVVGNGWMAVQAPDGTEGYTRSGELQISAQGELVTGNGLRVMGNGGAPIVLPVADGISIANDGTVTVRGAGDAVAELAVVDAIKLVTLPEGQYFKGVNGLMRTDDQIPLDPDLNVELRSGFLESSNVNGVHELTSMITLSRQFEMQIKLMKTAEENDSAAANILQLN